MLSYPEGNSKIVLDTVSIVIIDSRSMATKLYTTKEAAARAGISRTTIQYWITTGKIEPPELQVHNRVAARLWTDAAVQKMKHLAKTLKPGPSPKKTRSSPKV
jgi:hypothetical protein